jgi:hypothetical protein
MKFLWFRAGLAFRPVVLSLLIAVGVWRLGLMAATALPSSPVQSTIRVYSMQSIIVPFTVCKQSTTWTRPTPEDQAKIWNDPRYARPGVQNSHEWTHEFLLVPPDSTSIQGEIEDEAGLWTEGTFDPKCDAPQYKQNDEWVMAWILLHRVRSIRASSSLYTITVDPTSKGFQSIIFKQLAPNMTVRFVDPQGRVLEEMKN